MPKTLECGCDPDAGQYQADCSAVHPAPIPGSDEDLDDTQPLPFDGDARIPEALDYNKRPEALCGNCAHLVVEDQKCGNPASPYCGDGVLQLFSCGWFEARQGAVGSLTLEQELWVRGWCAKESAAVRQPVDVTPFGAGDKLLRDFRRRFPGVLP